MFAQVIKCHILFVLIKRLKSIESMKYFVIHPHVRDRVRVLSVILRCVRLCKFHFILNISYFISIHYHFDQLNLFIFFWKLVGLLRCGLLVIENVVAVNKQEKYIVYRMWLMVLELKYLIIVVQNKSQQWRDLVICKNVRNGSKVPGLRSALFNQLTNNFIELNFFKSIQINSN
jgi:hypothetical protein